MQSRTQKPSLLQRVTKFVNVFTGGTNSAYDAANSSPNRNTVNRSNRTEDRHLTERQRQLATANNRDLMRNYTVLGWLIRKHQDFVCDFSFKSQTTDPGFNRELEAWFSAVSKPWAFDSSGRDSLNRALRVAEAGRLLDGDTFWLKLGNGKIQGLESDRIGKPKVWDEAGWHNGIKTDPNTGRRLAYSICKFGDTGVLEFDRTVPARNIIPLGYYGFRYGSSQTRGISPLLAATNQLRDVHEITSFETIKAKIASFFALQVINEMTDDMFDNDVSNSQDKDGDGTPDSAPQLDFSGGPKIINPPVGSKLAVLESKTPSSETVRMIELLLDIVMLALDMPPSFRDVSKTNYNGSRSALIHYLLSCDAKIADLKQFQDEWMAWRLDMAIANGEIVVPSGKDWSFLRWEFIEGGLPFWNPVQEAEGVAREILMGLKSPRRAARESGSDFERNIIERAEDEAFAAQHGLTLNYTFTDMSKLQPPDDSVAPDDSTPPPSSSNNADDEEPDA